MPIFCFGQSSDKIIDFYQPTNSRNLVRDKDGKTNSTDENVLELVEIKVENKNIKLGEYFTAGDDWLKTMTVKVRSVSNKPISRIELPLVFPETKSKNGYRGSWIDYNAFDTNTGNLNEPKIVKPNETAILIQDHYEEIKQRMKESSLSTLNQIIICSIRVYFKDGSYWTSTKLPLSK